MNEKPWVASGLLKKNSFWFSTSIFRLEIFVKIRQNNWNYFSKKWFMKSTFVIKEDCQTSTSE